ncbi:preprotein translocase subunit SecG [Propioniferax innocua]|uniref:Protein-export membrane protein SecG n=2 Tax=Propioniferax innocua TaxID=1753 RepID=A0A542Z7I2_9ACTN|nr:preprotein translocase subunit SecG [Propioniferax innocua]
MGYLEQMGYTHAVLLPLMTTPQLIVSIVLVVLSVLLALTILMHKNRGGGMSDLFGGGMSSSFGGMSVRERNLDRITVVLGVLWSLCIIGLLLLYRFFPN